MRTEKTKYIGISVKITKEQRQDLKIYAAKTGQSIQDIVGKLLEDFLDSKKNT